MASWSEATSMNRICRSFQEMRTGYPSDNPLVGNCPSRACRSAFPGSATMLARERISSDSRVHMARRAVLRIVIRIVPAQQIEQANFAARNTRPDENRPAEGSPRLANRNPKSDARGDFRPAANIPLSTWIRTSEPRTMRSAAQTSRRLESPGASRPAAEGSCRNSRHAQHFNTPSTWFRPSIRALTGTACESVTNDLVEAGCYS